MFNVEITTVPTRRLGALAHRGPYENIGQCFYELSQIAASEKLWPRVEGMVAVHYDDPNVVAEKDLRAHAAVHINDAGPLPESLEEISLAGGRCAVLHYKGPYQSIKVAYDYLYGDWLPKSEHEPADAPPYEVYLNDPSTTAESELLTDIVLPLA